MYDQTIRGETLNTCEPTRLTVAAVENDIHDRLVELCETLNVIGSTINKEVDKRISEETERDCLISALIDDCRILSICLDMAQGIKNTIG